MSILRYDTTTNDWVLFAPERSRRPHDGDRPGRDSPSPRPEGHCPFCPGNEGLAGPEIFALRGQTAPDSPGWTVRVVPNKFPALRGEEPPDRREESSHFRSMGGFGTHDVIIESPEHDRSLAEQPLDQVEFVLRTLHYRFNDLIADARYQSIVAFKNHGEGAGASLRHPHWQLVAMPVVPRTLRLKHAVATDYFDRTGDCLYCVLLAEELTSGRRVVAENDDYAAIVPYAAHGPFETWIMPKVHNSSFGSTEPARLRTLAALLKRVLGKLRVGLDDPDFNLTVNTAPRGDENKGYFLWHMEIVPRLTKPAGFELGSGMAINSVLPEQAAEILREIRPA